MPYDPRKAGALCARCPRNAQVPVPPEGPTKGAKWCWLGQDPGNVEVSQLRPFVGPTGSRLTRLWQNGCAAIEVPVPREAVWITNTCLCLPVTKSAKEARDAADCCAPRLRAELKALDKNAGILAMGKWAFYALTGLTKGVGKYQGFHMLLKKFRRSRKERAVKLAAKRKKELNVRRKSKRSAGSGPKPASASRASGD